MGKSQITQIEGNEQPHRQIIIQVLTELVFSVSRGKSLIPHNADFKTSVEMESFFYDW